MSSIWHIGQEDGPSPDLPDNYKTPLNHPDVTWTVEAQGNLWPLYQASEADPKAGYRAQPRRIIFELVVLDAMAYELIVDDLVIAPRVPYLRLRVNSQEGDVYLNPQASKSGEICPEAIPVSPLTRDVTHEATVLLHSPHDHLTFDLRLGRVVKLVDHSSQLQLLGAGRAGTLVYVRGGEGSRILSNQADLPLADLHEDEHFELTEARLLRDALGETLQVRARVSQGHLNLTVHLPAQDPRVDFAYTYDKAVTSAREAAYVRFDFDLPDARVLSDSQLGWVDWNADRLPGACVEWLPLQSGVLLDTPRTQVFLASPDVPLFTAGDIVRGAWPKTREIHGGRIFSYLLNNYWHTNYQGRQGGPLHFRYSVTSGASLPRQAASRAGREARQGLYTHRISYQDVRAPTAPYGDPDGGTLAHVSDNVALSVVKPARDGRGVIVRVQELQGAAQHATVSFGLRKIASATLCDLLEYDLGNLGTDGDEVGFPVPAWGLASVRIEFTDSAPASGWSS